MAAGQVDFHLENCPICLATLDPAASTILNCKCACYYGNGVAYHKECLLRVIIHAVNSRIFLTVPQVACPKCRDPIQNCWQLLLENTYQVHPNIHGPPTRFEDGTVFDPTGTRALVTNLVEQTYHMDLIDLTED